MHKFNGSNTTNCICFRLAIYMCWFLLSKDRLLFPIMMQNCLRFARWFVFAFGRLCLLQGVSSQGILQCFIFEFKVTCPLAVLFPEYSLSDAEEICPQSPFGVQRFNRFNVNAILGLHRYYNSKPSVWMLTQASINEIQYCLLSIIVQKRFHKISRIINETPFEHTNGQLRVGWVGFIHMAFCFYLPLPGAGSTQVCYLYNQVRIQVLVLHPPNQIHYHSYRSHQGIYWQKLRVSCKSKLSEQSYWVYRVDLQATVHNEIQPPHGH